MARNNTKVSILVPIYGVEKYIERCARLLFEQTYENIEYVFVNDCTKDRSLDILKNVIEQYVLRKPHITIVDNERNLGLAGTRNVAMARATGDFVIHVDSDDYIERHGGKVRDKTVGKRCGHRVVRML